MFEQAVYGKVCNYSATDPSSDAEPRTEGTGVHHLLNTVPWEHFDTMMAQWADNIGLEGLQGALDR